MTSRIQPPAKTTKQRADGRRQLLVYLPPELIKDVKKIAVDEDSTASAIAEEALRVWLERRAEDGHAGTGKSKKKA